MMAQKRNELLFQNHIVDSYKSEGGYARKWATDLQVGPPDLIATMPALGLHLVEVKHRPEWRLGGTYKNPMEPIQVKVARDYINGGGLVVGAVIVESSEAKGSKMVFFDPLLEQVDMCETWSSAYTPGKKFEIHRPLSAFLIPF